MPSAIASPPNITATGIELFKVGHQTDSKGRAKAWTRADLDEIASSYNSVVNRLHDAPVLDEPAAKVQISHGDNERAYGWLTRAYRDGDVLKGDYAHVDPTFAEAVNSKQYRKRSISLYPPEHPSNPTPGQWNIRHVAYVAIPAVKGLADHDFEEDSDVWNFEEFCDMGASPFGAIAQLFQSLRDKAIEKEGLEKADTAYPQSLIDAVRQLESVQFASMDVVQSMLSEFHGELGRIKSALYAQQEQQMSYDEFNYMDYKKAMTEAGMDAAAVSKATKIPPPVLAGIVSGDVEPDEEQMAALTKVFGGEKKKEKEAPTDMSEATSQIRALRMANRALQAENKRLNDEKELTRVASFVEGLVRDRKVLPANKDSVIELAMALPGDSKVEFSEGSQKISATPRDRYLQQLDTAKPLYSDSKLPTGPNDAPHSFSSASGTEFSAAPGFSVDEEAQLIHRKAVALCQERNWDYTDSDQYTKAVVLVS